MTINVAYSCNEVYIHHTGISIISLLETNKHIPNINIFLIQLEVKQTSLNNIIKLVNDYGRNIEIISFYDLCYDLKIATLGRHIETIYAKLFFSRIRGIDKILYLDSDTIINDSLEELWELDIQDFYIAGVSTFTVDSKRDLKLAREDQFINDGVVLLNLKAFRVHNLLNEFIRCIEEYKGSPPVLSEGVINKVCKGRIKILHPKYNLMSGLINYKRDRFANMESYYDQSVINEAITSPVIIHYLCAFYNRPWNEDCTHPLKNKYLNYKSISIWNDLPLEYGKMSIRLRYIKQLYAIFPTNILDFFRFIKNGIFKFIISKLLQCLIIKFF